MGGRALLSFFASAGLAAAAPVLEAFYEWLAPDQTTVLCSSRVPGSCDPYSDDAIGEETILGTSVLQLLPGYKAHTIIPISLTTSSNTENYLRLRYAFNEEIDLGWYAFEGGTGDFVMEYRTDAELQVPFKVTREDLSFSYSSPFPNDFGVEAFRNETFGRPFRLRGHHGVVFDKLIAPDSDCCDEWITFLIGSHPLVPRDLSGEPLPFEVRLVPAAAPIPEPGGLTIFGLCGILGAATARKYRKKNSPQLESERSDSRLAEYSQNRRFRSA